MMKNASNTKYAVLDYAGESVVARLRVPGSVSAVTIAATSLTRARAVARAFADSAASLIRAASEAEDEGRETLLNQLADVLSAFGQNYESNVVGELQRLFPYDADPTEDEYPIRI